MNTRTTLAIIAAVSTLATPVVVKATGSRPAAVAAVQMAWIDPPAAAAAKPAPVVQAAASEATTCARKVRVVYQGYGAATDGCAR